MGLVRKSVLAALGLLVAAIGIGMGAVGGSAMATASDRATVVKFSETFYRHNATLLIPCKVDRRPTHCLVDTGFGHGMLISPALASKLGIVPYPYTHFHWLGNPAAEAQLAPASVSIDGRQAEHIAATISAYWGAAPFAIIGADVLRRLGQVVTINFKTGTMKFRGASSRG